MKVSLSDLVSGMIVAFIIGFAFYVLERASSENLNSFLKTAEHIYALVTDSDTGRSSRAVTVQFTYKDKNYTTQFQSGAKVGTVIEIYFDPNNPTNALTLEPVYPVVVGILGYHLSRISWIIGLILIPVSIVKYQIDLAAEKKEKEQAIAQYAEFINSLPEWARQFIYDNTVRRNLTNGRMTHDGHTVEIKHGKISYW